MRYAILLMLVGLLGLSADAFAAEPKLLDGLYVLLYEKQVPNDDDADFDASPNGLVVVRVDDTQSRSTKAKVEVNSDYLEKLGEVRGSQLPEGDAVTGGSYNLHLYRTVKTGLTKVKVSYKENGEDGREVERNYKLEIEKP